MGGWASRAGGVTQSRRGWQGRADGVRRVRRGEAGQCLQFLLPSPIVSGRPD